jgi:aminocarboxymuconate-semialdehyde decarboxylase
MVIDFHSHFVPQRFPDRPAHCAEPAWPAMQPLADGSGATMWVGDRKFRDFGAYYWDVPGRLATMDANGIDLQVISPLPELFSYWLEPAAGIALTEAMNAACVDMVAQSGGRLRGMGILALQDPDHAVGQVRRIADMGLSALFAGSHVNGRSIASETFYPVLAAAEAAGLPLFIHGVRPGLLDRIEGPALMAAVLGIPYEGTTALGGFIATDIFARFPALQIVFAHGGGMIASVIDRMELVWRTFPAMQATLNEPPTQYARRFWYDSVVFSPVALRHVADRFGADRVIAGTDGPTEIGQTDLPGFIAQTGLPGAARDAILGGNAARLLGL